jgi:hypothetical protein
MLPILEAAAENDWRDFTTGDESWLFLQGASKRMRTLEQADVVEKPRLTIQGRKLMFPIMERHQGFHVVDSLPDDTTMSSTYVIDNILTKLAVRSFQTGAQDNHRQRPCTSTIVRFPGVG